MYFMKYVILRPFPYAFKAKEFGGLNWLLHIFISNCVNYLNQIFQFNISRLFTCLGSVYHDFKGFKRDE